MLGDGEGVFTLRLTVPPADPGQTMGNTYFDIHWRGIYNVSRRPLSIRCQARPGPGASDFDEDVLPCKSFT